MQKANSRRKVTKIVLTGGHGATTAIATVEELAKTNTKSKIWDIYWIGARSAVEGKKITPIEVSVFSRMGISIRQIVAGRLQRRFSLWTIPSLIKIPIGFLHALYHLVKIKPDVILSFGGFTAFPVVVAGYFMRIPIILHEQTVVVGRANKYSSLFANKIALAREESMKYFPKAKCVVVGNPVMEGFLSVTPKSKHHSPLTLFITGGSRGSLTINTAVEAILPKLLVKFQLIHHTGPMDYKSFLRIRSVLASNLREKYELYEQIDPKEMFKIYDRSDLIISRAGANTVSEIFVTKIPALLIPIPWSYGDEQTKNARYLEKIGVAKVLNQESLTGAKLYKEILFMANNWEYFVSKAKRKDSPDRLGAKKLVDVVEEFIL